MKHRRWLSSVILAVISIAIPVFHTQATVVTSIRPLGFIAAAITEGIIPVEVLLPDGASPHDYALRPSDLKRIKQAELFIWIGPEMEAFLRRPLSQLEAQKVIALSSLPEIAHRLHEGIEEEHDDHHHGKYDLHIWMSPVMARQAAITIHQRLLELMPHNKKKLDANLQYFEQQLQNTLQKIDIMLQPVQDKGYFVFHDAYGYFEREFGLNHLGHFTINPGIQPGAQRLHIIKTQLTEHKAKCVFAEPQFRSAIIDAVIKGTDVQIGILDPLGSIVGLDKDSYVNFLQQLSHQFVGCLEK